VDIADEDTQPTEPDTYEQDCIRTQIWFCPTISDVVLGKEISIDICAEPNIIVHESECKEIFECDPSVYYRGKEPCITEDGLHGTHRKYCDKGHFKYTECVPCEEEICDGTDNNCDGIIDNIEPAQCPTMCGFGEVVCVDGEEVCEEPNPQEEICDGYDNDCDGEIDEGQTNACGTCGYIEEVCDGIDNDCNGETDEELYRQCSTICDIGYETCINGMWSLCTAQAPFDEICNGLDDDCDGNIDEELECICSLKDVGTLYPCTEPPLICGQGYKQCVCATPDCEDTILTDCHALCWFSPDSQKECEEIGIIVPEDCNNFDDNCNNWIDENLARQCYSGPLDTLGVGICQAGEQTCFEGVWGSGMPFEPNQCLGEVTPLEADRCNGVDEDCDGVIDDNKEMEPTDILFIIDWSGSMSEEINAVLVALTQFSNLYSDEDILRWGLVAIGVPSITFKDSMLLASDLLPFSDFMSNFQAHGKNLPVGVYEMIVDALWMSLGGSTKDKEWLPKIGDSTPPKDEWALSWRSDAGKLVIVWTDEEPQSYLEPTVLGSLTHNLLEATPSLNLFVFTTESYAAQWEPYTSHGNGEVLPLTYVASEMYESLLTILDENVCK
jgi:hypothetical protein